MTTQQLLDERYGRRRSPRARLLGWVAVGSVAVAATALLAWSTIATALTTVDVIDTGFALTSDTEVTVRFQVTAPIGSAIACAVEAQDEQHGTVGWRVAEYPPSADHTRAFEVSVPTLAEPTTGFVNSCWVP